MWAIAFDLNSAIAKTNKLYRKIFKKLSGFGFKKEQYSVYTSNDGINRLHEAVNAISAIPYLKAAVRKFNVFRIEEGSDFKNSL